MSILTNETATIVAMIFNTFLWVLIVVSAWIFSWVIKEKELNMWETYTTEEKLKSAKRVASNFKSDKWFTIIIGAFQALAWGSYVVIRVVGP